MKIKDMRPGAAVALRASNYDLFATPRRHLVISTEHRSRDTWGYSPRSGEVVDFEVTDEVFGEIVTVSARVDPSPYSSRPKEVLLARKGGAGAVHDDDKWYTEWATPAKVEGPWEQVDAYRATQRQAKKEREDRARAAAEQRQRRADQVFDRLVEHGLASKGIPYRFDGGKTSLLVPLADMEAIVEALDRR